MVMAMIMMRSSLRGCVFHSVCVEHLNRCFRARSNCVLLPARWFAYARKEVCERRRGNVAPTIRHSSSATGTPLQGSAHIYPLVYALNSPRIFAYASNLRPSSIRIPVDQPEITNSHRGDVAPFDEPFVETSRRKRDLQTKLILIPFPILCFCKTHARRNIYRRTKMNLLFHPALL